MENATKALIIAGAILVAILLVTMGISLLGNTGGLQKDSQSQMTEMEIRNFNGRLEVGIGQRVKGSDLITMIDTAATMLREDPELRINSSR